MCVSTPSPFPKQNIIIAIESVHMYRKAIRDDNLGQNEEKNEKDNTQKRSKHTTVRAYLGANASLSNSQNRWRVHLHSEVTASARTHNVGAEQCEGELTPQPGHQPAVRITGLAIRFDSNSAIRLYRASARACPCRQWSKKKNNGGQI